MNAPQTQAAESNPTRKKALTAVAAAVAVAGIAYGAYYALVLNHFESTDNAYVQGNVVQLTPQVGGTVLAINADDTDFVKAGQPLVKLDTADARVALDQAEAQLAQTVREVRILFANNATLQAQIALREADQARAESDLARAQDDLAKRSVQVGQRVQAGAPLMSVIALDQVWVDANFKESQLQSLRIGQPVSLKADLYGKKVEYHGKIEGLGAGTGAAFALLPAQNATGNWIKVVQRVPVRVSLDPRELADHPLRVGLSMDAKVDISDTSGKMLADAPRRSAVAQTAVFDEVDRQADDEVRRIVATNLGRAAKAPARAVAASAPAHTGAAAPVTAHVAIAK